MPKCFVRKCSHSTGQKSRHPEVSLHHFPKDIKLIQEWLRLAGVEEENLEFVSTEILEDKRSDKYRMCSAHFTQDSYVMKGLRRFLKAGARPCIFPGRSAPTMQRIAKLARIEQNLPLTPACLPVPVKCTCKCHIHLRARLVNASTQTEESDFRTLSLVQANSRLANQQQVDHDYSRIHKLSGPKQPTVHKSMAINVAPSAYCPSIPVKNWERTQQIEPEEHHKENSFLNSIMRSCSDEFIQEEVINPNEESPFKISADIWGTVEIKQENAQSQCDILLEKPSFTNKLPFFDPVSNRNRQDYVSGIKKEDPKSEYGFLHTQDKKSNLDNSGEKPIQWRVMPSCSKKSEELEMIVGEAPSFDIITVDDWESVDMQIKKENAQKESHILHLEDLERARHNNNMPLCDTMPNHNRDNYVCGIKKETIENEYNLLHAKDANSADSSIYHKVKTSYRTEAWDNIQKKKEDPCHDTDDTTDTDNSGDEDSPTTIKIDPHMPAKLSEPKCSKSLSDMVTALSLKNYSKEKKYVVFESCLDALLVNMHCQQKCCMAKIKEFDKKTVGSLLVVFGTCCEGHYTKLWESQPCVNGIGAGNVLLAALLVLTGLEFAKIKELCDLLALQIFSESSIHQYRDNILPVIDQWMRENTNLK